jgi:dihydroorotate dehydrogenase
VKGAIPLFFANASLRVLRKVEPELAHALAMRGLRLLQSAWPAVQLGTAAEVCCAGLRFAHPVGVAAGFDKDGDDLDAIGSIGFGHIEVGTVTPLPQPGNPKPRLHRLPEYRALVNRMGFNSKGADYVVRALRRATYKGVRGVSIGKNAATPIEDAVADYVSVFQSVYPVADYIALNVSSPNTSQLRELQGPRNLGSLVGALQERGAELGRKYGKRVPLFVKVAPDMPSDELSVFAQEVERLGVDGVIATNTTVDHIGVPGALPLHEDGGLSGEPLHQRSIATISQLRSELGPAIPIIGVGGIMSADAALETLRAGANLIQLYTGFVYRGPQLLYEILDSLPNAHFVL